MSSRGSEVRPNQIMDGKCPVGFVDAIRAFHKSTALSDCLAVASDEFDQIFEGPTGCRFDSCEDNHSTNRVHLRGCGVSHPDGFVNRVIEYATDPGPRTDNCFRYFESVLGNGSDFDPGHYLA